MKNSLLLSLVGGLSISLSGCGHHVIYQQVVKTDVSAATNYTMPQEGLTHMPAVVRHRSSSHLGGVMLQQMTNGMTAPATQLQPIIPPQQQKTLMLVPNSRLNSQGVIMMQQPNSTTRVQMVRIPVLAMPAQATQQQTYLAQPHNMTQSLPESAFEHLKPTPMEESKSSEQD
jgi:hypothetical protein